MRYTGLDGPGAEAQCLDPLANGNRRILMRRNRPVRPGRLVEKDAADKTGIFTDRVVDDLADSRMGRQLRDGRYGFAQPTNGELLGAAMAAVGVMGGFDGRYDRRDFVN